MNDNQIELDKNKRFWNRFQLIMVVIVFTAPLIGAFLYKPNKLQHYGDFHLPTVSVPAQTALLDGTDFNSVSETRKWLFLVTAKGNCDQPCEDNILKMRQLRAMQNNNMQRIRTVFLHTNLANNQATDLAAKYRPIESYATAFSEYNRWDNALTLNNAPLEAQQNRFYIIDPAGRLIMSYPAGTDPYLMRQDIKRLLKTG